MCTHEGTRYGSTGCRRTYLSQRDLQAHINHRHVSVSNMVQPMEVIETERTAIRPKPNDPRAPIAITANVRQRPAPIQTTGVRTNLITVPIQDTAPVVHEALPPHTYYNQYQQTPTYTQTLPPMNIPPPQQAQYYTAPPSYSPAQTYSPYTSGAPPPVTQYAPPPLQQQRTTPQYDYASAPPPQWTGAQQYYR